MCGIAGYIGRQRLGDERLRACLARMRHRGPDHQSWQRFETPAGAHVCLLHARLKILDLDDRANQPMAFGPLWLTYNGELYNHVELRHELENAGVRFRTTSDTEVLLAVIEQWGWGGLDRCEGMWSLACYDERDGSLHLSRDRFGEKPLYLYNDEGGLYFASEPKGIMALRGRPLAVNRQHIRRYLVHGYKSLYKTSETFFDGLAEIPAATTIHFDVVGRERQRERYWCLKYRSDRDMTRAQAVKGVFDRLVRAVEIRLRADVPLAFCLSGGVDSTALTAIARKVCQYDVHGFSIVNDDPRYDERDVLLPSVAELQIRHSTVLLQPEGFLPALRDAVCYHDAPVLTIAYFVHSRLMAAVADAGYRISVSGTAADELLTGYYDHHLAYLAEVSGDPELHAAALDAWCTRVRPYVRNPFLQDPDLFVRDAEFRDHIYFDAVGLASALTTPWGERFEEHDYTASLLRNRMMNELFHENVPVMLHEDDCNAMSYSIENRSPYLDRALAEFSYTIPTELLVRDGFAKAVLRDAVRGIAPDVVLDSSRKVGFNAPIFALLDPRDPEMRQTLLADSPIFDLVRRERIEELLDRPELPNSLSKFLFSFTSAKVFLELFT
jgi:asparagine synthase (glutamine-hydrolysing)